MSEIGFKLFANSRRKGRRRAFDFSYYGPAPTGCEYLSLYKLVLRETLLSPFSAQETRDSEVKGHGQGHTP